MNGLLLKDWYALKSYCRANIFMIAAFAITSGVMEGNFFFAYYTCILAGIITMNLIAYEEKEKWEQYAATLPYTKAQMVSSKYIVSLGFGAGTILLNMITQLVCMFFLNTYDIDRLLSLLLVCVPLALLPAAFLLPFVYKFGVNKGRIAYLCVLVVFFGALGVLASNKATELLAKVSASQINVGIIVFAVSLVAYALSWALSIHFYKNREI